jgi:ppGpp synthetase/RelA/SpoT-type nucleotidyltranferase
MPFVEPGNYTKGELDRAGNRLRENQFGVSASDDLVMLENWRASHLYVINTFQAFLRSRRNNFQDGEITIAQRLKRRPTIIDKLSREPGMSLSRMHDIAGCRLIFDEVDHLRAFRNGVLNSRIGHELVGNQHRYDYIASPKSTGYRGIHDIYKYKVRSQGGQKWNGLRIELQYRTKVQHSWATAVEISDIVNSTRLKFDDAGEDISRLFLLASDILSRAHEGMPGFCADLGSSEILGEFDRLESKTRVISRLRGLTSSEFVQSAKGSRYFILVNYLSGPEEGKSQAFAFKSADFALMKYSELESDLFSKADIVLVRAREQDAIKLAYTNYFSDASQFLDYLERGRDILRA